MQESPAVTPAPAAEPETPAAEAEEAAPTAAPARGKVRTDSLHRDLIGDMVLCAPLDTMVLTSGFGYRKDPFTGKRKFHYGCDYRTCSENVYAMMPGKVRKIGYNKVLGNYIELQHGDFTVTYAHLHTVVGTKGDYVRAGQSVGISGSTGRSTGEHLHLAVRYRNKAVDPHPLVQYLAGYGGRPAEPQAVAQTEEPDEKGKGTED